jgi:hypothetical protein
MHFADEPSRRARDYADGDARQRMRAPHPAVPHAGFGLRPCDSRRRSGGLEDHILEDESLEARSREPHERTRHLHGRGRQGARVAGGGDGNALGAARSSLERGNRRGAVLPQNRVTDGTRRVVAPTGARAHVRRDLIESVHDAGQTAPACEHRDEERDDDLEARKGRSHRYAS